MNAPIGIKKSSKFGLEPGKLVEILIDYPTRVRLSLVLIGYEAGNYIILKRPPGKSKNQYADVLVEGNTLIGHYIIEGQKGLSCGFKTSIRHVTNFPDSFLILNYPKHIHHKHLRKHQRIDVHLPVKITVDDGTGCDNKVGILGIIMDITPLGCALEIDPDDIKTDLTDSFVRLDLYHPLGQLIELDANVCNSRVEHDNVSLGVSFVNGNEHIDDLLKHLLICTSR